MVLWDLIPTCDDAMSCYTLIALAIIVGLSISAFGILIRWNLLEFEKFSDDLKGHDEYIKDTAKVINDIQIELAVQQSSMKEIKADIAKMKSDIKADIASLQVDIKTLLRL